MNFKRAILGGILALLFSAGPVFAHSVTLSFTGSTSSGVTQYNIYRTKCVTPTATVSGSQNISCPAGAPAPAIIGTTTTNTYVDSTVTAGNSYQYYVTSVVPTDTPSESGPSNIIVATVPPSTPVIGIVSQH